MANIVNCILNYFSSDDWIDCFQIQIRGNDELPIINKTRTKAIFFNGVNSRIFISIDIISIAMNHYLYNFSVLSILLQAAQLYIDGDGGC